MNEALVRSLDLRQIVERQPRPGAFTPLLRTLTGALACLAVVVLTSCGAAAIPQSQAAESGSPSAGASSSAIPSVSRSNLAYNGVLEPKYTVAIQPQEAGRIVSLNVDLGSRLKQGDVIAQLEHAGLDAQLARTKANLRAADAKLKGVQAQGRPESVAEQRAKLDAAIAKANLLKAQGRPEQVAQAQASLDSANQKLAALQQGRPEQVGVAQAKLDAAKSKLQVLLNGPTKAKVQDARLTVEAAKDKLYADQTANDAQVATGQITKEQRAAALTVDQTGIDQANLALKSLLDPPTPEAVRQTKSAVDEAQHELEMAQHPGSAQDIAAAQSAVQSSQQLLALARSPNPPQEIQQADADARAQQAAVALAAQPYTPEDIESAAAGVAQAQAAVDIVQNQITDTTITAPVDGVVAQKLLNVGDSASLTTPIVTLVSLGWQVSVPVAEEAIDLVRLGDEVQMTATVFPSVPFTGKIAAISPVIDPKSRTFTVQVEPAGTVPNLRAGMSTRVDFSRQGCPAPAPVSGEQLPAELGCAPSFSQPGPAS